MDIIAEIKRQMVSVRRIQMIVIVTRWLFTVFLISTFVLCVIHTIEYGDDALLIKLLLMGIFFVISAVIYYMTMDHFDLMYKAMKRALDKKMNEQVLTEAPDMSRDSDA